jgi:flavin reductase (DIM6/NTAB) family NADH-FMN oxidoreductase RutF
MKALPLHKAFTLLEPGPVVLVTTADGERYNIMTLSWTMVLDFSPRFAVMTGPWNYSYQALTRHKVCVVAVPTVDMSKTAAAIGACSGADVDKFKKFKLSPLEGRVVNAPLIRECYANIECRVVDHIQKHGIFVLEAAAAWIDEKRKERRFFHALGDGRFIVDGERISHRKIMAAKLPEGV